MLDYNKYNNISDAKIATVDYFGKELTGGVQTILNNFNHISNNIKMISTDIVSGRYPYKPVNSFHMFASSIIDDYLKGYERFCSPDLIIKNSIVGTFHKPQVPMVSILQDNNITGPDILFRNDFYNRETYKWYRQEITNLQKTTFDNSDTVVSVSKSIADDYKNEYGIKSVVINNGIDTDFWYEYTLERKKELRKHLCIPEDAFVIMSFQKLFPIKGFHIISKLAKTHKDIYWLLLMGDGHSFKPRVNNVIVFNPGPPDAVRDLYHISDVCIQPSAVESFNLTAVEAMSCGIPVIVSNTGIFMTDNPGVTSFGIIVNDWTDNAFSDAVDKIKSGDFLFEPRDYVLDNNLTLDNWKLSWTSLLKKYI